ncbi:MAG: hypothetical protein U0Q47_10830 [Mycobacterium sp.]
MTTASVTGATARIGIALELARGGAGVRRLAHEAGDVDAIVPVDGGDLALSA